MSNVYNMFGKKKVVLTEKIEKNITYKEIMTVIVEHATEKGCRDIFCRGGIDMCPSDVFNYDIIEKNKEQDRCNYGSVECTKCWTEAIRRFR